MKLLLYLNVFVLLIIAQKIILTIVNVQTGGHYTKVIQISTNLRIIKMKRPVATETSVHAITMWKHIVSTVYT